MRKAALLLVMISLLNSYVYASEDGRIPRGVLVREGVVLGRGVLNVVGTPLELVRTPAAEWSAHHWLWPVSVLPRTVTHIVIRATSAVYDIAVNPFAAPFTDDLSPITEPMGLPEYAWSRS